MLNKTSVLYDTNNSSHKHIAYVTTAKKTKTKTKSKPKSKVIKSKTQAHEIPTAPLAPLRLKLKLRLSTRLLVIVSSSLLLISLTVMGAKFELHTAANKYKASSVPQIKPHMYITITEALSSRPNTTLVGSERMLKKLHPMLGSKRATFVLNGCPSANDAVMKQLQKQKIAVLVRIQNAPGKDQCTLEQIVAAYGRPNASTTLIGTLTAPKQVLMFYDNGPQLSGPIHPISPPQAPATVVPTTLATIPVPTCAGKTYLNFVAHEDDDLLFMNPHLTRALRGGDCLRTVYLTAGDDGLRSSYWLGREKGVEAAYDTMAGHGASVWIERYITVNNHEYIKMASPRGSSNITLIFVNLPDGNVPGGGFQRTHYESLAKLWNGSIATAHTVDGQSTYTKSELTNLLVRLMQFYHPSEIDTQTPLNASGSAAQEHSDHMTAGQFAASAYGQYGQNAVLKYYTGYPISLLPQNVIGQDQADKMAIFNAYAPHDTQACLNPADCAPSGPYASWSMREYTYTPGDPLIGAPSASVTPAPVVSDPATVQPTN